MYVCVDIRTFFWYSSLMARIKASKLRANIYKILDSVIDTGEVVEVERGSSIVRITADKKMSKLSRLKKRKTARGRLDNIFNITWEKEWTGDK